ncbi:MAG: glycosyltransferase family 2 protein [Candidatus Eisenbacteria bacterium]
MRVAVIVPAYLTGPALLEVLEKAAALVGKENVIVIDDGSPDGYPGEAQRLGYTVLRHEQNAGKGEALKTGFRWALAQDYAGVITMDGDGQHDASLITRLLEKARMGGADIIVGSRMRDVRTMPRIRVLVNRITSWVVSRMAGLRIEDSQSGFRFISADVLRAVELEGSRYDMESEILIKAGLQGFRIDAIPIPTLYGTQQSYIRPFKDAICFMKILVRCRGWAREQGHARSRDKR